jgi:hypothetical protein
MRLVDPTKRVDPSTSPFEESSAFTILAPKMTPLDQVPPPSVVADLEGPYQGQDAPPNAGAAFHPPIHPYLDSNYMSRGSLIVKKNAAGRRLDDNAGDWTEFVSGAKADRSGRIPNWDMPDRDLAHDQHRLRGLSRVPPSPP